MGRKWEKGKGKKPRKLGVGKGSRRKREGLVQFVIVRRHTRLPAHWVLLVYTVILLTSVHSGEQILAALVPSKGVNGLSQFQCHEKTTQIPLSTLPLRCQLKEDIPAWAQKSVLVFPFPALTVARTTQSSMSGLCCALQIPVRTQWNYLFWGWWCGVWTGTTPSLWNTLC